jgi:hypothetical protein
MSNLQIVSINSARTEATVSVDYEFPSRGALSEERDMNFGSPLFQVG